MVLSAFTLLCYHHHHPSTELFYLEKLKFCTRSTITPHFSLLQPLETTILLSVFRNLTTPPHISGFIQYLSFCNWFISISVMFSSSIHVVAYVRISSKTEFQCMYTPHFAYTSIHQWAFEFLLPFGYCKYCCCKPSCTSFHMDVCFHFS